MKKIMVTMLNDEQKEGLVERVSRGRSQEWVVHDLVKYGITDKLNSYMKSQRYGTQYVDSYLNVIDRLQNIIEEKIEFIKGPRGGYWSGFFKLHQEEFLGSFAWFANIGVYNLTANDFDFPDELPDRVKILQKESICPCGNYGQVVRFQVNGNIYKFNFLTGYPCQC